MKDAWPVKPRASGGRHYRGNFIDQNFDTYSVEYTFADGTKLHARRPDHAGLPSGICQLCPRHQRLGDHLLQFAHPARCRIYKGHNMTRSDIVWAYPPPEPNPYQDEWDR